MSETAETTARDDVQLSDDLAARRVACRLLNAVVDQHKSFDILLDTDEEYKSLPGRERAFIHMLLATSFRHLRQIDDLIIKLQDKPNPNLPPQLQHIMRLGMVQVLFMAVADHAAVDTSVRLCEEANLSRYKNMVNAVLRRLLRDKDALLEKQDPVQLNIPAWLLKGWIADWGLSRANEIATSALSEAPLDITVKQSGMIKHWCDKMNAAPIWHNSIRLKEPKAVTHLPGFEDGQWWVQDSAAALPARLFPKLEGKTVADLCAAPGGKTAQLAAAGANVIALDRSAKRLARLEENMARLGLESRVEIEVFDAAQWTPTKDIDAILLDAPCTATGVIRRHPDILHLKDARDLDKLVQTQARILARAAEILPSGAHLIYCTCSTLKAEGEEQIAALLSARDDLVRDPVGVQEAGGQSEIINEYGDVRIFNDHLSDKGGLDGFFISRLLKR